MGSSGTLHVLGDVVDGVDDICRMSVVVILYHGMSAEVQPLRLFRSTDVPSLVNGGFVLPSLNHHVHLLHELLLFRGMDMVDKLLQGHAVLG